jgi:hypothetical protein
MRRDHRPVAKLAHMRGDLLGVSLSSLQGDEQDEPQFGLPI